MLADKKHERNEKMEEMLDSREFPEVTEEMVLELIDSFTPSLIVTELETGYKVRLGFLSAHTNNECYVDRVGKLTIGNKNIVFKTMAELYGVVNNPELREKNDGIYAAYLETKDFKAKFSRQLLMFKRDVREEALEDPFILPRINDVVGFTKVRGMRGLSKKKITKELEDANHVKLGQVDYDYLLEKYGPIITLKGLTIDDMSDYEIELFNLFVKANYIDSSWVYTIPLTIKLKKKVSLLKVMNYNFLEFQIGMIRCTND